MLLTILATSTAPSGALAQTHGTTTPISVHLSTPQKTATVGATIHIEVRVTNDGDAAVLVPNAVSVSRGDTAYLELELTDAKGRTSPRMNMIADYPPVQQSDDDAAAKLLRSFALLHPHTSLLFDMPIDKSVFKFLGQPGDYKLSGSYASNGISRLGLSEKFRSSLPYSSWEGKVATNEISLTVASPNRKK